VNKKKRESENRSNMKTKKNRLTGNKQSREEQQPGKVSREKKLMRRKD